MIARRISLTFFLAILILFLAEYVAPAELVFEEMKQFSDRIPESDYDFTMVPIPKGTIEVEDPENPGQKKTLEVGPFWIGKTEVTWQMFTSWMDLEERAFMLDLPPDPDGITGPSPPYVPPDQGWGRDGYPALTMSHFSATEFCRWISRELGKQYRLPTEAEWEYVCRAGSNETNPFQGQADEIAWHQGNSEAKTHPIASKEPNAWGINDLLGNAAEWCDGLDGKPVLCGGWFATPSEELLPTFRLRQTRKVKRKWLEMDPQIPQSKFWLAGPTFHGLRLLCEGKAEPVLSE